MGQQRRRRSNIGIDYSLTKALILYKQWQDLMFFYLTNKEKVDWQQSEDIIGYEHKEWTDLYKDLKIFQILFLMLSIKLI